MRRRPFSLHLRFPTPDGHDFWGASLTLPSGSSPPLIRKSGKAAFALRPTPAIEVGFGSLVKSMGFGAQFVSAAGLKVGAGIYFNKVAIGAPSARQAMVVLEFPLPW